MKRFKIHLYSILYLGAFFLPQFATANLPLDQGTDRLILKLKSQPQLSSQAHRELKVQSVLSQATQGQMKVHHAISSHDFVITMGKKLRGDDLKSALSKLAHQNDVERVEPDRIFERHTAPNDPLYSRQWNYYEDRAGLRAELAWDITRGSNHVTVAVIDTGILFHEDIVDRVVPGYDFVSETAMSNDGDGWDADPTDPGDFSGESTSSWHGLHVAGTIAATSNNSFGVTGVNWRSKVVPIRVLGVGGGYESDIAAALRWAAGLEVTGTVTNANPARVINLSLGGLGECSATIQSAIDDVSTAGAVVVVSAGNSNANLDTVDFTPANCLRVLSTAALSRVGQKAYYSNFGSTVDISAPGGDMSVPNDPNGILSLGNSGLSVSLTNSYSLYQGTSMAAPHVSGVASLLFSINSTLSSADVRSYLLSSARGFPNESDCTHLICGSGMLDAPQALTIARGSLLAEPGELDFETVQLGTSLQAKSVRLTNNSSVTTIQISSVEILGSQSADYALTSDSCSQISLLPLQSCELTISFYVGSYGSRHAYVRLHTDHNGLDTVALHAFGVPNQIQLQANLKKNLLEKKACAFKDMLASTPQKNDLKYVRYFRDQLAQQSHFGRKFVNFYYRVSPYILTTVKKYPSLKKPIQASLRFITLALKNIYAREASSQ